MNISRLSKLTNLNLELIMKLPMSPTDNEDEKEIGMRAPNMLSILDSIINIQSYLFNITFDNTATLI